VAFRLLERFLEFLFSEITKRIGHGLILGCFVMVSTHTGDKRCNGAFRESL
jgi:hypothetical protein